MFKRLGLLATVIVAVELLTGAPAEAQEKTDKIKVVIIDGQNNHNWKATTPFMKRVLEETGRFTVDVSSYPKPNDQPGSVATVPFPPDLSKYQVVLSNYNGQSWPAEFNKKLDDALNRKHIGLVIVHAANNAFDGWKEYNQMIGMGWRGPKGGARLKLDDEGKEVRVPSGKGDGSGHRYTGPFQVVVRDNEHPITKGMPREWMHAPDELYDNMRGPIENVHLLATAYSKGTKANEPMIWTVKYGEGRVFHTPMGHDLNGMRCVGFITTLGRGTEWAATGRVTLPIPRNFPPSDKAVQVPAK